MADTPQYFDSHQTAARCGLTYSSLRQYVHHGFFPQPAARAAHRGKGPRRCLWTDEQIAQWIAERDGRVAARAALRARKYTNGHTEK